MICAYISPIEGKFSLYIHRIHCDASKSLLYNHQRTGRSSNVTARNVTTLLVRTTFLRDEQVFRPEYISHALCNYYLALKFSKLIKWERFSAQQFFIPCGNIDNNKTLIYQLGASKLTLFLLQLPCCRNIL